MKRGVKMENLEIGILEKCRCGNTKPKLNFNLSIDPPKKVRKRTWQVICLTCDIRGPKRNSSSEAVKDWNNLVGENQNE